MFRHESWKLVVLVGLLGGCASELPEGASVEIEQAPGLNGPRDEQRPDYDRVFDPDVVRTLRISLSADDYAAMYEDLAKRVGPVGPVSGMEPPPDGGELQMPEELLSACADLQDGDGCSATVAGELLEGTCIGFDGPLLCLPIGAPGEMRTRLLEGNPLYVEAEVELEGERWRRVGFRFKGNSSLAMSFQQGNRKLPFRLDLDRFDDLYPELTGQRLHGFEKITFASNFGDDSQLREALVAELLREAGVPAARWAFYRVMLVVGDDESYLGLYTALEDPADGAMLEREFGSAEGNLYKPDGGGADWTRFDADGFVKKSNRRAADYSDVQAALDALHSDRSDPAAWRARLEATFDVRGFLRWLAVNTAVQNWDAYGRIPHNYYLYGVPSEAGRLVWIPWDHNLALGAMLGGFGSAVAGAPSPSASEEVLHTTVRADRWPLIRHVLDDPEYAALYREELERFVDGPFAEERVIARARALHALIAPHVVGPDGERDGSRTIRSAEAFEAAIDGPGGLAEIIARRHQRIREALQAQ